MRIVDRKAFLAMPEGTIYAKYEPCVFGEICIKGETLIHNGRATDWYYVDLTSIDSTDSGDWADKLEAARVGAVSLPMDFVTESRDGLFDEQQLFAVWERGDVESMISRLRETLETRVPAEVPANENGARRLR